MEISAEIAKKLLQIKAIKLSPQNPFTWASGMRSPIYCDNRVALSHPTVRTVIKKAFGSVGDHFGDYDYIAGVATAGIAHGALMADYLNKPFIYVRGEAKSHGRQNQIEGEIHSGAKALVIEDLISTGGSSIKAVRVLEEVGVEVIGVMAIFDYEFQKAKDNFSDAGIPYYTLSGYSALIKEASETNYITQEEEQILSKWNANPADWYTENFK